MPERFFSLDTETKKEAIEKGWGKKAKHDVYTNASSRLQYVDLVEIQTQGTLRQTRSSAGGSTCGEQLS